jgi:hypothetical protein
MSGMQGRITRYRPGINGWTLVLVIHGAAGTWKGISNRPGELVDQCTSAE